MPRTRHAVSLAALAVALTTGHAAAAPTTPEARAAALVARMTTDEKIALVHGHFPMFTKGKPAGMTLHAGYIPGIPRLGIPDLQESDASLGVANAGRGPTDDATSLPSGLALAATFDPEIAYAGGAMIGKEARQKGYNILLAGGVNLVREPRNGRNFEYLGEDPLLAGTQAGASIKGIQSNHIVSTIKHYALNAQETGRHVANAVIDPAALQESDLLAFHIAIEAGRPGSVMCAYNKVNGLYACENGPLFDILKKDWGYKGWVMSDWGAVHSAEAALTGLDQESGQELDKQAYFDAPLKADLASGKIPMAKLDEMVTRIVYGLAANGVLDHPVAAGGLDTAAEGVVAQRAAESAIVLLKNTGDVLPLAKSARNILVVGGHADIGVLSGGGSSQVVPVGSTKFKPPSWAPSWGGGMIYQPSSPLAAIRALAGGATVTYDAGTDPAATAAAAAKADLVIVFATQWATEGSDVSLTLPDGQDALITAVATANPKTVVVLETGGPVLTPWIDKPAAVLEAWYPGSRGGEAIARVLFGEVNPSGRLPVSFPTSEAQLPRPKLDGDPTAPESLDPTKGQPPFDVHYTEGAEVGYRWYEKTAAKPQFSFGYGLSYTRFSYSGLKVSGGKTLRATFTVTNSGKRAGIETPQVYAAGEGRTLRLVGFTRVALKPGERRTITIEADPRVLATFDGAAHRWRPAKGRYAVTVGPAAGQAVLTGAGVLP